jgi:hypothetical protein
MEHRFLRLNLKTDSGLSELCTTYIGIRH